MSSSQSSSPLMIGNSIANYVELAALIVPQRKLGVKDKLRGACTFLPMPLSLGWDTDPGDEETPPDSTIPGLLLSDIGTGATRLVTARWMHALYKHIQDTQRPGTLVLHLHEASYTARFSWAHALILGALLLQFLVIPVAMLHGQQREGWLLLAAGLIRIGEGVFAWAYPMYREPRMTYPKRRADPLSDDTAPLRYCALHTGMTTHHILVITHRFGYHGKCVNLEDAAVPLPRKATGWRSRVQDGARAALRLSVWLQKGASLVTYANGYTIPAVLLFGTSVLEFVSASADALPARAVTVLPTGPSVLDRLAAACQFTDSISVGFVESLLPDPRGHHTDFEWIKQAMQPDMALDLHPTHPTPEVVRESTLRRRRPQDQLFSHQRLGTR